VTLRLALCPVTMKDALSTNLCFSWLPPELGRPGLKGASISFNTTPLAAAAAEGLEHGAFVIGFRVGVDGAQVRVFRVEQGDQAGHAREVGVLADVVAFYLKEVEGVEGVAYRFAI